jgi:catechol 2,3-dioxygenase-like lactoylglutathione lyase family enzyme
MPRYKFHHTHLISSDPEKTAEFYMKIFGAEKGTGLKTPSGGVSVPLQLNGSSILVSSSRTQPPKYGLDHFGIATDNMEATVKELKSSGAKFQVEPTEIRPGTKIAFFWAPENVLIELVEDKSLF